MKKIKARPSYFIPYFLGIVLYTVGLAFFYYKYVPLVKSFQFVLVPILLAAAFLAWKDIRAGTLFFIFAFPLINNLPYFFGIYEPVPHAPAALVLFLFYFLGYLCRRSCSKTEGLSDQSIIKPITLFSLIIITSGLITFLRYANFFPFLSPDIFELTTNMHGVSAGGAIMSVIFQALNYLTGMGFFLILLKILRSKTFLRQALFALCLSSFLSIAFAVIQHSGHLTLGNNPTSIRLQLVNGTFKDALSFGCYLSMVVPLFLGVLLAIPEISAKVLSFLVIAGSLFIIMFTGSRSGVAGLLVSTLCFVIFAISAFRRSKKPSLLSSPKKYLAACLVGILIVCLSVTLLFFRKPIMAGLKNSIIYQRFQNSKGMLLWRVETQWKPALRMMVDYPITGVGMGAFIIEVANYSNVYKTPDVVPESTENYILQVGSELGVIGIIIVLWIAWEILRRTRKGFSQKAFDLRTKFLLIGAMSGVIAFIISAQTHTYIGSYEIKYTLWLLVGVIFAASFNDLTKHSGEEEKALEEKEAAAVSYSSRKPFLSRRFIILAFALIVLYGSVHLWNSTHSLSLKSRTELLGIKQEFGLDKLENTNDGREFRWTRSYGGLTIKIEKPVLAIPLLASHPDIRQDPISVKIYLVKDLFKQKRLLGELTLNESVWKTYEFSVSKEEVGQEAILLLKVNRTWNPLETTGAPDPRNLGVAIGKITFRE